MADETTPTAAAEAPATEATPTTNTQTEAPAPAAEAPATPVADIPADKIEAFNKFVSSNGGFEKAFAKLRNDVSTPAPEAPKVETPVTPAPQEPAQPQVTKLEEGFLSPSDIAALQYQNMLASDPKYEKISDYIKSDSWLKEMKAMGMTPVDGQGNLNNKVIRQFLDLKASTVAAQQPATPVTSTPTVDYVEVGEAITDINKAYAVLQQNIQLAASGRAEHPKTAEAKKFISEHFASRKNGGRK